jgi:hypothetical protein
MFIPRIQMHLDVFIEATLNLHRPLPVWQEQRGKGTVPADAIAQGT